MINNVVSVKGKQPNDGSEKRSLLVVEDNPPTRLIFKHMLKTKYQVEIASCVAEALQLAQERPFDALVLDINFLGEPRTGIDLLHLLRQMPAYRQVPVVACTALIPVLLPQLLEAGFDECVEKPFTKERLHAALERVFNAQLQSPRL